MPDIQLQTPSTATFYDEAGNAVPNGGYIVQAVSGINVLQRRTLTVSGARDYRMASGAARVTAPTVLEVTGAADGTIVEGSTVIRPNTNGIEEVFFASSENTLDLIDTRYPGYETDLLADIPFNGSVANGTDGWLAGDYFGREDSVTFAVSFYKVAADQLTPGNIELIQVG